MRRNAILTFVCTGLLVFSSTAVGHAGKSAKPAVERKSRKQLLAQVSAMRVEKVAWRKIAWKPCLLDGIRESRKQKKPMILWIFIDRPIDDERC